ncbi:DNA adenine methylase [Myxococcota bacterium]|nr:DNA adenine methylase [Myxococcota bacterium]
MAAKKKPESSVATSGAITPAHPTKNAQSSPASVETYKPLYTIEKSKEWVPEPDDKDAGEWVDFYTIRNRKGDVVRNRQGELVERKSEDMDAVIFQLRALDDWKQVVGDDWERFTASEFDGKPKKALHITPDLKLRTEAMQRADRFALQEDDDNAELRSYLTGILFHNSYAIATNGHRAAYIPTSYANDGEITTLRMDDFGYGSVEKRKILPSHYPTNSLIAMLDILGKEEKVKKHTAKQIPRIKVVFNTIKAQQILALMMKTLSAFRFNFLTLGVDHKGVYFAPTYHEDFSEKLSRRFDFFRVYFSSDALASSDHQAHEIHVNGNYLLQALQSGDESEVSQISFYHQDPINKSSAFGKPICVRRGNGEIHIIMPIRSIPLAETSYKEHFESWLSGYRDNPALFKGDKPTPLFYHIGAKNQLWPHIRDILGKIGTDNIAEPFAGSAVVSRNYGAKKIYLAEQNSEIREVFQRLKKGNPETLFRQMLLFEVEDHLQTELDLGDEYKAAKALHHRIFRDPFGRFQFPTDKLLSSRLQVIKEAAKEMRKAIIYADALDMIEDLKDRSDVTWFVDPPYPEACHVGYGERGKCYNMDDYNEVLTALSKVRGPVMITGYENMRPPKRMGYKEKGIEVDVKIGKSGKGRKNIEYIWWKA